MSAAVFFLACMVSPSLQVFPQKYEVVGNPVLRVGFSWVGGQECEGRQHQSRVQSRSSAPVGTGFAAWTRPYRRTPVRQGCGARWQLGEPGIRGREGRRREIMRNSEESRSAWRSRRTF